MRTPKRTLRTNVGSTSENVAALMAEASEEAPTEAPESEPEVTEAPQTADVAPDSPESESEAGEPEESESEVEEAEEEPEEESDSERPHGHFGKKEEWYAFRLAQGYTEEELEGLGRNALRDTLEDR